MNGRRRLVCMTLVAMVATPGLTSTTLLQNVISRRLVLDVDDPRPLSAAARQLERQLGIAVTYEDGSYVAPEDIVDVTAQVRRDGRTEPRVLVMRGGAFTFESALTVDGAPVGIRQVLDRLVATWNHSGMGGEFAVADVGGGLHVVPTARRGVTGELEPYTPPLSAPIDMPTGSAQVWTSSPPSHSSFRSRLAGGSGWA